MEFEAGIEEIKSDEDENLEVACDLDSKKKFHQSKKEIVKQLGNIDELTDWLEDFVGERKEMWRQDLHEIEQKRNEVLREHQKIACSQKLQSLQDIKKLQCQKKMGKWVQQKNRSEETEEAQAEMEDIGQQIHAESLVEAELDFEIRGLPAGEGRRGSNASKSNGCCMDPAVLQHFLTSGAYLARQQPLLLQSEFGLTYGVQHERVSVTPIQVPKRKAATEEEGEANDEEQRKSASREFVPGGRNEGFAAGFFLDSLVLPRR